MSVDAVQERLMPLDETAVAVRPVGTDGGIVSADGACVVALALDDCAEVFPAASKAAMMYEYCVDAFNPVSLYVVPDVALICTPLR